MGYFPPGAGNQRAAAAYTLQSRPPKETYDFAKCAHIDSAHKVARGTWLGWHLTSFRAGNMRRALELIDKTHFMSNYAALSICPPTPTAD